MFLSYFTLVVALCLSAVAAWYSILGLTAIFAAAVIPIVIMGTILEVAKVTVTVWLHHYWSHARWLMKIYLVPAVVMLALITSMGIFGFLSKAHSDQSLVSGDVLSKISIYDDKIRTERENIEANRRALKQMDEAVDQSMARSSDEKGADKAVALRRGQARERTRLLSEITESQKKIATLNEERAPIAAEVRKVEAEVGPIKYIAALIYGDNPDANLLERAVRWVIIILVIVFDPLALTMVLAANESLKWERAQRRSQEPGPKYEPDDGPLTDQQADEIQQQAWPFPVDTEPPRPRSVLFDDDQAAMNIRPPEVTPEVVTRPFTPEEAAALDQPVDDEDPQTKRRKAAMAAWKADNPEDTLKHQRNLLDAGKINNLPWETQEYELAGLRLQADNAPKTGNMRGFGSAFPESAEKGDMFVRLDYMPSRLFKYNGTKWMEVDKKLTDQYSYQQGYIDWLIEQIDSGAYDPEWLTDAERDEIQRRLTK
jgi:hypothetical protein